MFREIWSPVLDNLSAKDIVSPLVGGVFGWFAAIRMSSSNEKIARAARLESEKLAAEAKARKQTETDVDFAEVLTKRFQVLISGYEVRIADLVEEVQGLRCEVTQMRRLLGARDAECAACPVYLRWVSKNAPQA
jgi:hypothetical protein